MEKKKLKVACVEVCKGAWSRIAKEDRNYIVSEYECEGEAKEEK